MPEAGFGRADELIVGGNGVDDSLADLAEDGGIEFGFIAEVIVDTGEAGTGAVGDFFDGGGVVAALGEDVGGGLKQTASGVLAGGIILHIRHLYLLDK